jgi:hypothetical protein
VLIRRRPQRANAFTGVLEKLSWHTPVDFAKAGTDPNPADALHYG